MLTRLVIAAGACALSLLVIVPAPNTLLWIATVLVTAWSQWFILGAVVLLAAEWYWGRGRLRLATTLLCLATIALEMLPWLEAMAVARHLPAGLSAVFGPDAKAPPLGAPLQFRNAWWSDAPLGQKQPTLHYATDDGTSLALDFYSDGAPGAEPCIIVVHGGSWHSGGVNELEKWDRILSGRGYRVASIAYRLAPEHPWPAQKQDLLAALTYLKTNASRLGIDPGRFVLLGRSAGAQIILATAYAAHDASIRGCIASYAPTDMNFDYGTANHSLLNAHKVISQFLGGTPDEKPALYRDASPLQLADAESPPTLLAQGTRDELVWIENSRKLRDRLEQLHRPVYLLELPWATHGFDANPAGPGGQLEGYAMRWFLASVLTAPLPEKS